MQLNNDERRILNAINNHDEYTWQQHKAACGNDSVRAARAQRSLLESGLVERDGDKLLATDAGVAALPSLKEDQ